MSRRDICAEVNPEQTEACPKSRGHRSPHSWEACPDCGNLLVEHSDDHPCPNPPHLDPRD